MKRSTFASRCCAALPRRDSAPSVKNSRRTTRLLALAAAASAMATLAHHAAAQNTATWNGGAGNWNTQTNWAGGFVPNSGTVNVVINGGNIANSVVNFDLSATVGALTIEQGDSVAFSGSG